MPRFVGFFAATHAVVAVCLVAHIDIESHKNRLLKVCYVPATSTHLLRLLFIYFFAAATNSTNEAKQGRQYALLSSLYYLDVYGHK